MTNTDFKRRQLLSIKLIDSEYPENSIPNAVSMIENKKIRRN